MVQSTQMSAERFSLINRMGLPDCRLFLLPSAQNLMVYYRPRGGNLAMAFLCDRMLVIHGGEFKEVISAMEAEGLVGVVWGAREENDQTRGSFVCSVTTTTEWSLEWM